MTAITELLVDPEEGITQAADVLTDVVADLPEGTERSDLIADLNQHLGQAGLQVVDTSAVEASSKSMAKVGTRTGRTREEVMEDMAFKSVQRNIRSANRRRRLGSSVL